jgi:hypothetical protein
MDNPVNQVKNFTDNMSSIISTYEQNLRIIEEKERELSDIGHEIELSAKKNVVEGYKIYSEERNVRKTRRQAKDENEILQPIYEYLIKQNVKDVLTNLEKTIIKANQVEQGHQTRIYKPKVRNDLTITNRTPVNFDDLLYKFKKESKAKRNCKYL